MFKIRRNIILQAAGFIVFCVIAAASGSSKGSSSNIDWRGAGVGFGAGYNGYTPVGTASSENEAAQLAGSKGYDYYLWDSDNGVVYAK